MAVKTFDTDIRIGGVNGPQIISGAGTPEAVVTAPVGSMFMRTDGGTNTTIYRKESGVGNTGWVAVSSAGGGGGSPGGAINELQFNDGAGGFAGAADVEIEGGQLRLPTIATPTAPAAGGLKFFARDRAGQPWPAFLMPASGEVHFLQPLIANGNYMLFMPAVGTTVTNLGMNPATLGTVTGLNVSDGSRRARMKRIGYRITAAAATAVAGWRHNASQLSVGGAQAWEGGFWGVMHGGPDTGVTNASHRFFMGVGPAAAPTDVNPSTLLRIVGIGYDAADTELQLMHNDGTGAATKIALGAGFPKPNVNTTFAYRLRLYSPPGPIQSVSYEVENMDTGAVASGTITTNLPALTDLITPFLYTSVGGVSSVVGVMVGPIMFQTED